MRGSDFLGLASLLFLLFFAGCQADQAGDEGTTAVSEQESAAAVPDTPIPEDTEPAATATAVPDTPTPEALAEEPTPMPESGQANADVIFVQAVETAVNIWRFNVTVAHPDTGWDDYADGWDVVLPDETVVKPDPDSPFTRLLLHPHETEQPFTRSQSNVNIPADVTAVTIRAHDLVDGFGGQEIVVNLEISGTTNEYEVTRLDK